MNFVSRGKMTDELLQKAVQEISTFHRKIIDDWCKAYLSQLYQEKGSINPGDFILYEQMPTMHDTMNGNIYCKKYWFEPKDKEGK
jgi:hypothetical protein